MEPTSVSLEHQLRTDLKFNIGVNMLDAAFFGLGWGFASFGTIIPLFVSQMTHSAILIGLIPAIHAVGWQLPQLFTANRVARLRRYKPMVMLMTIHERVPFLGLALVAWPLGWMGNTAALVITFLLLIWQGLGSGFTANPWQSMIAKIIPSDARGTFFGVQAAVANIIISGAAVAAGYVLDLLESPLDFVACFLAASAAYGVSMIFLGLTREPEDTQKQIPAVQPPLFKGMGDILRRDSNFRWYLIVRFLYQFATMGFAFYIVYGLRQFNMDAVTAGYLTAALTISSTLANAGMGWLGDRVGHRAMLVVGMVAAVFSSALAWAAPNLNWFYVIMILSGLANVAYWTIGMVLTVEFGSEADRPVYIGMSNTLIAPATIFAPLLGGWIADTFGYQSTFALSALLGVAVTVMLITLVKEPRRASW